MRGLFVTGTDTGVGKTYVACALARGLRAAGIDAPLPQGCASTTVELRGETDVNHALAAPDAQAVMAYLVHLGVLTGERPALPPLPCTPTPLAGSETLHTPVPGVVAFHARPGDTLAVGDPVADVIDPTAPGASRVHTVRAGVAGVLYATVALCCLYLTVRSLEARRLRA